MDCVLLGGLFLFAYLCASCSGTAKPSVLSLFPLVHSISQLPGFLPSPGIGGFSCSLALAYPGSFSCPYPLFFSPVGLPRPADVLIDVLSGEEFLFRLPGDRWEPSPADYEAPLPAGEGDFEGGGEDNDQEGDVEGGDEQRDKGTGEPSARSVGARQRAPAEGGSTGEPAPRSDGLSCSSAPPTGGGTCSPPSSLASASPWASASPPPSSLKRPRSPGESHDMALTLGDLDALIRAKEETSGQSVDEACLLALGEVSDTRRLLVATRFREFADVVRRGLEGVVRERGQNVTLTAEDVQNMLGKNK